MIHFPEVFKIWNFRGIRSPTITTLGGLKPIKYISTIVSNLNVFPYCSLHPSRPDDLRDSLSHVGEVTDHGLLVNDQSTLVDRNDVSDFVGLLSGHLASGESTLVGRFVVLCRVNNSKKQTHEDLLHTSWDTLVTGHFVVLTVST